LQTVRHHLISTSMQVAMLRLLYVVEVAH